MKLTDRSIAGIRIPDGRPNVEVFDSVVPALSLRVGKTKRVWTVRRRKSGRVAREAVGMYPEISIMQARVKAAEMAEGRHQEASTETAVSGVAVRFIADYLPQLRPSTQQEWRRLIEVEIVPTLGDICPADYKTARATVRATLDTISKRSGYTANRTYEVLRRLIKWGIQRDLLDPVSGMVCENLERPMRNERPRTRVLSDKEVKALWGALRDEPPGQRTFWRLALYTGQRRGEILAARWDQIDLQNGVWRFEVKGGHEHWLGLPSQVMDILRPAHAVAEGDQYVLPARGGGGHANGVQKSTGRLRKKLKFEFRPHDVRRTVASNLGALRVSRDTISDVLSHTSAGGGGARVTRRHYNLAQQVEPTREALQLWADRLDQIVSGTLHAPSLST